MVLWLWAAIGVLALVAAVLLGKVYLLRKAAKEIEEAFAEKLITDSNTLIDLSSRDKAMRRLAQAVNAELRTLRRERHRFRQGDAELKNAVTNISHDLRTPLTAIYGYLELLEQAKRTEDVRRYAGIIRNRADLLKQLTEELFRYSVILAPEHELKPEEVVVNHVLEESIAAFYTVLNGKGIVPHIHMPERKIIRSLDAAALTRVFSNLLSNAAQYSDGDLEITLSETGEITFSNDASELDEVQIGKLFDRFYTVNAARKSTGLGMSIAKNLVEQMNGTIAADYEGGRLSITITIPDDKSEF